MKVSWSYKIALLYLGFVALIMTLVYKSTQQKIDLVADDYYEQELAYQQVIDAGKNQSNLSAPVKVQLTTDEIVLQFPDEFKGKTINGVVHFYSPKGAEYDKEMVIKDHQSLLLSFLKKDFAPSKYIAKITWQTDGKQYYQQTDFEISQ